MRRNRIVQARWVHVLGIIFGVVFVLVGIVTGANGVGNSHLPILVGLGFILLNAIGLSVGGLPTGEEVEVPDEPAPPPRRQQRSFAERLRDLEDLRDGDLIDEQEYERKRAEILRDRW
ncbi:MAG: SHOCT domain-containing protein [Actinomycetota bacterium]